MFQVTLKAARVNAGLTQEAAAKALGKTKGTLCRWEQGKGTIDIKDFLKMCDMYHVAPERVLLPKQ